MDNTRYYEDHRDKCFIDDLLTLVEEHVYSVRKSVRKILLRK